MEKFSIPMTIKSGSAYRFIALLFSAPVFLFSYYAFISFGNLYKIGLADIVIITLFLSFVRVVLNPADIIIDRQSVTIKPKSFWGTPQSRVIVRKITEFSSVECVTSHAGRGGTVHCVILRSKLKSKTPWYRYQPYFDDAHSIILPASWLSSEGEAQELARFLSEALGLAYGPAPKNSR